MGIGHNIKEFLKIKGKTIKWLAEETGISVNTLYSITKRDSERINIDSLNKIAKCLEVPTEVLADIDLLFVSDDEKADSKTPVIQRKHLVGEMEEFYHTEDLKNAIKLFDALGYKMLANEDGACCFAHKISPHKVSFSMSEDDVTIFYEIISTYAVYLENRFLGAGGEMPKEEKLNEIFKWLKLNREMLWKYSDKEDDKG